MAEPPIFKVCRLSDKAVIPQRKTPKAAGYSLCSALDLVIPPGNRATISTDLQLALPDGTYGRIAGWLSLATDRGILIEAGIVDPDYRGNVQVVIFNEGDDEFSVHQGDRVAQLVITTVSHPPFVEVKHLSLTGQDDPTDQKQGSPV